MVKKKKTKQKNHKAGAGRGGGGGRGNYNIQSFIFGRKSLFTSLYSICVRGINLVTRALFPGLGGGAGPPKPEKSTLGTRLDENRSRFTNDGKEMYTKSVMHVQSCCFANQTYCFFCRSRCRQRRRCLSSLILTDSGDV